MSRSRRGRGEGGVGQRADGRWYATIAVGHDAHGKRQRIYVYGKSKAEVTEKRNAKLRETIPGEAQPNNFTVATYLDHWMATKSIRRNTLRAYKWPVQHIKLRMGHVKLAKLAPSQIQALYTLLAKEPSKRLPSMVHEVLRAALTSAVQWRYLTASPMRSVSPPRKPTRAMSILTKEQLAAFVEVARSDRYFALYVTASFVGAREGELLALRWRDVDLTASRIQIKHTLLQPDSKGWEHELGEPKTAQSRRTIDLPQTVVEVLKAHKVQMLSEGFIAGPVFCDEDGGWVRISNMQRRHFKPLLEQVEPGLGKRVRFHDLRHGLATYLLEADIHPKKVSTLLGHANVQTTMKTYSHVLPAQMRDVADRTDQILPLGGQQAVKKAPRLKK
jgi:integrase